MNGIVAIIHVRNFHNIYKVKEQILVFIFGTMLIIQVCKNIHCTYIKKKMA